MIIANNYKEIKDHFDFTDSIITDMKWNNPLDLSITIDYYWDTQENREENRTLALHFKDCLDVEYKIKKEILEMSRRDIHFDSLFTIILFENVEANSSEFYHFHIYTFDYKEPLLKIICKQVQLEEV
ncbi:hypothetical protein NSS60_12410 [Anoxybacillus sp. FSL W8-0382]|uniref:hypothetical protein n=1 Tax=Anoxybacillus TaxID=150247 RepID=UPI0006861B16|nr:hypothetical protein [Anoxybacillus flavithermus]ASA96742.1 hypothetical protein CA592_07850 [Anoxybacillus flavithermus]MBE2905539.1 hypothetical protein [Anoxybacillus flavithermus]MBE2914161.1 hypothetical protein [Anoxybacillus flavithermus]MBE2933056.1 hypothetical protein [Anoxybacillus flavithermus]MBE2941650.1 hypothetical protein [Anoxybacillus flavithermus]